MCDSPDLIPAVGVDGVEDDAFVFVVRGRQTGDEARARPGLLEIGLGERRAKIFVHDRQTGRTEHLSRAGNGSAGNGNSEDPAISSDGRYVAFESRANNLVTNDTNGREDIFVHDRQAGTTVRVSVASNGGQGNDRSRNPGISGDGRLIVFQSHTDNLVESDTNEEEDIFVHDRVTGVTSLVSLSSDGSQSDDGSHYPSISPDGRYVTFYSGAENLVPGDTGITDVFLHDRQTGVTERVSMTESGGQANGNSYDPSVRRFDTSSGRFETCAFDRTGATPTAVGMSFPVLPGQGYVLDLAQGLHLLIGACP